MREPDLFEPFDKLIEIDVMGRRFEVPENNTIMRCLQYIRLDAVSYGEFCWNGECLNCQVWIRYGDKEKPVLACRTNAFENMEIVRVSEGVEPAIESIMEK
jgi:NADH dehydrogenase/NADH:ubiquinone oxidoreductase subunit G